MEFFKERRFTPVEMVGGMDNVGVISTPLNDHGVPGD